MCFTFLAAGLVCLPLAFATGAEDRPQEASREPYGLKYELRPGMQIITFHTQQGRVRVTLPDPIVAGQRFSGTVEAIAEGASTATLIDVVEVGQQQAVVRDGALRAITIDKAGPAPLILKDFRNNEIARFDLRISEPSSASLGHAPGEWKGDRFRVPDLIEATSTVPLLGPFDGNSAATGFKLGGVACQIITEIPGKAMSRCVDYRGAPTVGAGPAHYEITKGEAKAEGETHAIVLQLAGVPAALGNGKHTKMRLTVSGLAGIQRDAEIKIEVLTPTLIDMDPDPPISYFPHDREYIFISPKDVKPGGSYVAERSLMGIQYGDPIEITAKLVIPTTPHEAVEQILRTPRKNLSKYPGVEHAEALAAFGDSEFPLVAEFLTDGELAWEAEYVLFQDRARAAPLLLGAIPRMDGQPLGMALDLFLRWANEDAGFPYRRELHEAARTVLAQKDSASATYALATTGTEADIPVLEAIYRRQQKTVGESNPASPYLIATEAALARLGSAEQIENIKAGLRTVVKTTADSAVFTRAANEAAFAGREEFVPLLCGHLNDPHWWFGDYGIYPGGSAVDAINAIRHSNLPPAEIAAECAKH